ncbi:XTP/dITP diphosphatase [Candidatus Bathyarchaeota archaeon]|nr:XTP/dITP diphosphatase [Candidatus Bathyarchaeota archaeon]
MRNKLIFFATGNIHKFNEARRILAEYNIATAMIKVKTLELQDDNIENIARLSAIDAASKINLPVIVEDAGLFIDALNGFPGPYSSYVYRTIGKEGIIKLLEGVSSRKAYFKSVVAFCSPDGNVICFEGIIEGKIAMEPRGSSGFGFDPIFEPAEQPGETFGEMSIENKNRFSHRAKAVRKFAEWYRTQAPSTFIGVPN